MRPIGCPETSARNYRSTVRNNQEEGSSLSYTSRRKPEITHVPSGVRSELRSLWRLWSGYGTHVAECAAYQLATSSPRQQLPITAIRMIARAWCLQRNQFTTQGSLCSKFTSSNRGWSVCVRQGSGQTVKHATVISDNNCPINVKVFLHIPWRRIEEWRYSSTHS
jgi:hypothetical protein